MKRKNETVKRAVKRLREEYPNVPIEVLYHRGGGWDGHAAMDALPETEWNEYRVSDITEYTNLIVVTAF